MSDSDFQDFEDGVPREIPSRRRVKAKKSGCGKFLLFGLLLFIAFWALLYLLIDVTNSGDRVRRLAAKALGIQPQVVKSEPEVKIVEKEKIVEVPVEKIVEKIVEVKPPMPSKWVDYQKIDLAKLWNGLNVESQVQAPQGDRASVVREMEDAFQIDMTLKMVTPKPSESAEDLASINPNLPKMLPDFAKLIEGAKVSPFYHYLYELKTKRIQQYATRMDRLLSRHNLYDCETVLELTHPDSGQKTLLIQGEMDVVSDGSDGDRWPELDNYITMSPYYQPFTSYGWGKRTSNPNPLLARWQEKLTKYKEEYAIKGLSAERNQYLNSQIKTLTAEIEDMSARSYLIAEADPFIVIPLSFLGRTKENSHAPSIGDYAVVIHENKMYPAIAGDAGPSYKCGEASLRIAKTLNEKASPYNRPESDLKVTYLVFPGTRDETKGPPDLEKWHAKCSELMQNIGGIGEGYELHQWEDLIAKKQAELEAAKAAEDQPAIPRPAGEVPETPAPAVSE